MFITVTRLKIISTICAIRCNSNAVLIQTHNYWLLFGVNEKLLTQHLSGLLTKYKLLYVSNQGRAGARAWARVRARAKG